MTTPDNAIPPRLQEIIEDFKLCEGEEKLQLLLEFSDKMPPLPEYLHALRDSMEQVHECMTPVFIHADMQDGGMVFHFDVPQEAPTVRGYAAVMREGLHGSTPQQVMELPIHFYEQMGIDRVIGPQRLRGLTAMLAYIKRLAFKHVQH
jgi:cysteine desulfuration protein SufE